MGTNRFDEYEIHIAVRSKCSNRGWHVAIANQGDAADILIIAHEHK